MPEETAEQISEAATIAAEMIAYLGPLARIDASLVVDLRERLQQKTGCSWETARQCILMELQKRSGVVSVVPVSAEKTIPDPDRPKSNYNSDHLPSGIAVRGTPEKVKFVRRVISDNRQRLTILLDWIETALDEAKR